MGETGFWKKKGHGKVHRRLENKAEMLRTAFIEENLTGEAFISFIWDDIIFGHIRDEDMILISFLREKG